MRLIITLSATALLAACTAAGTASTASTGETYADRYAQLGEDCRARGGILVPSGGRPTGNPATEFACDIRSGGVLTN